MTWAPAQKPGDRNVLISDAKAYLDRFSYGKSLGKTDEYTPEFGVALLIWQSRIQKQIAEPVPQLRASWLPYEQDLQSPDFAQVLGQELCLRAFAGTIYAFEYEEHVRE